MSRLPSLAAVLALLAIPAAAEVCNVKVVTDASPDYYDMASMIRSITGKWPTTAEKCWAMFYWNHIARRQTAPMELHGLDLSDPIRQFNDYGFTMCSTIAGTNCSIWDAMGLKTKYWDISLHTVPEVEYDGRWHMYDDSMSALYTLCDGKTIAGVADIGKEGGCEASGGRVEKGHVARYHCLTATSARGFLTGADCMRSLDEESHCFNPKSLQYRYYYYDWDRGHRYILDLRDNEVYTRYYKSLGTAPGFYVPNHGKDPEAANTRYRIRGNGTRSFRPALTASALPRSTFSAAGIKAIEPSGIQPAQAGQPGEVIFRVEGANVITALVIQAVFTRKSDADLNAIAVSTTNGLTWKEVWKNAKTGESDETVELIEPANGSYEVLVKVSLMGKAAASDAQLNRISFDTTTMLDSKTQPKLLLGKNTVYVGVGDQTQSIVFWPDLQGSAYKPYVAEEKNTTTKDKHPGYMGVLYAAKANEEAYVVFKMDAPNDITRVTYGGRFYNRAPRSHIDLLHSFDGGKTWKQTYTLTETKPPWDVIHYETVSDAPAGTRSVLLKYLWNSSAAGTDACSIYAVRMEANYKPADTTFQPIEVTFEWSEVQKDRPAVKRSHTQLVEKVPARYTINVGGYDLPIVNSLRVNLKGAEDLPSRGFETRGRLGKYGYSDGKDVGGEKFVYRWVTYGKNLAEGKPYTCSVPSEKAWGSGDPDGKKLTDGVVGPPYAGGAAPGPCCLWSKGKAPIVTVDLGKPESCGAFRIHLTAGWPWWDALKGEVQDKVEVLTSMDDKEYTSQGFFDFDLRWKDIPINHMMPDDETAQGYVFALIPHSQKSVQARYVRFKITPERMLCVSEVQVLDFIKFEPFDLRIALPDDDLPKVSSLAPTLLRGGEHSDAPASTSAPAGEKVDAGASHLPSPRGSVGTSRIDPAPAGAPGAAGEAAPTKKAELKASRLPAPPKIDGGIDEEAWKEAASAADFRLANGETAKQKLKLLVGQDDKNLYVAVQCFEDEATLKDLVAKVTKHDGDEIWTDDDIELFIDPSNQRQSYYQIIVNSRGVTWDAFHSGPNHPDLAWEPKYEAATKIGKDSWTAEFAIPWSAFDRTEKSQANWAFNVAHHDARAEQVVYWSPVLNTTAHTPANFGTLVGISRIISNANLPRVVVNGPREGKAAPPKPAVVEKMLFDFEDEAGLKDWAILDIPNPKGDPSFGDLFTKSHPVKFELSAENATSGKASLKLTFAGGLAPAVTTAKIPIPGDWSEFQTLRADVTVGRPCIVGFRVMQEKSQRGEGWDPEVSRWEFTPFLHAGKNEVAVSIHPSNEYSISKRFGNVAAFEIYMYKPREGESVFVDAIRLTTEKLPPPPRVTFTVPGTGLIVAGIAELANKLKDKWTRPEEKTLDQVMADCKARFEDLKKAHPKAVMAVFRDGEKRYDPANPEKVYDGWRDTYVNSHGPDGSIRPRMANFGKADQVESFMRHRGELMRVDLSSIPKGANVLEAWLIEIRAGGEAVSKPNLFVAEPCCRPWEEYEVNAYEYARDKFWKAIGGMHYGPDPDFLPTYLAFGPAQGAVNVWDFTRAVKFWTDGQHENHGFFLHGDSGYYWRALTREAKDIRNRPAVVVLYDPEGGGAASAAWPQLGGPKRDGISGETGLLKAWPPEGPKLLWTASGLGIGFSAPAIADGMLFIAGETGDDTFVYGFDLDGRRQWKSPNGACYPSKKRGGEEGARGTPAVSEGLVYHLNPLGRLAAFDAKTGKEAWVVNYAEKFDAKEAYYGYCESVLLDGENLISYPGGRKGYMVALNKRTGEVVWANTTAGQEAGYCSPIVFQYGGLRLAVTRTRSGMVGVNADTGELLWRHEFSGICTPIYADGCIFVNAPEKSLLLKLHVDAAKVTVTEEWKSRKLDGWHEGAVLVDGHLYGSGEKSPGWTCLDLKTGAETYRAKDGVEKGGIGYADGMLYCLGEKGTLALVKPNPQAFEVVSKFQLPNPGRRCYWTYPVICGGRLYIRQDDKLYAYDIKAQ